MPQEMLDCDVPHIKEYLTVDCETKQVNLRRLVSAAVEIIIRTEKPDET
jgi:hypothetical protein